MSPSFDERYDRALREMLLADPAIQKIFRRMDSDPKLVGAGLIFVDKKQHAVQLRPFTPSCRIKPIHIILHEIPDKDRPISYAVKMQSNQRESKLVAESLSALLGCGAAVLGWLVFAGSGAAAPLTAISVLAFGAASASSIQCGVGLYRTYSEVFRGGMRANGSIAKSGILK